MRPSEIRKAYLRGENITTLMKESLGSQKNTEEIIETAYDLQAGSYVDFLKQKGMFDHKTEYGRAIAELIMSFGDISSILEPGVGEGTTLSFVLKNLSPEIVAHGFDISWSRMKVCEQWLSEQLPDSKVFLNVASICEAPYRDNSFDVVYTSHTIEPNGGNEEAILKELYRVTSKYLILLEPGYELATIEQQKRMDRLGYCRGLVKTAKRLNYEVIQHELFPYCANPENPTALTVIRKNVESSVAKPQYQCPAYQTKLKEYESEFYSDESLRMYPKIKNIGLLRKQFGVIGSGYLDGDNT